MSGRWRKPRCASNKAAWRTQGEANRALERILVENAQAVVPRPFTPTRSYKCRCGAYHLTSQEKRDPRTGKTVTVATRKRRGRQRSRTPAAKRHLHVAPETVAAPPVKSPEPVAYLPTDPWAPERAERAKQLQKANLGERARERLEHPWPWPRRSAAA